MTVRRETVQGPLALDEMTGVKHITGVKIIISTLLNIEPRVDEFAGLAEHEFALITRRT